MARWQRHARLGFGLFALVFATALWFLIGERQTPAPPPPVERLDPKAVSEIKGGDVVQVKGATRDIRVEFATQVLYSDGSAKYTGFKAMVDDRGGRSFEIAGNDAQVAPQQSAFDVRGDVTLRTSDGLLARTSHATFAEADGVLRGKEAMTFSRARVTGSGVGFRYDRTIDRLELADQAVINVAPAADGSGAMAVTAGNAAYSRAERFMRFERHVKLQRTGQDITADAATVFLLPQRDEPQLVELRGNSRISGTPGRDPGAASPQMMQARDINLRYAEDGRTLEQALLGGQSTMQLSRPDGTPGQQLVGETIDAQLAPDGTLKNLLARDNVRVTLPAVADSPPRIVSSQTLQGTGVAGRGLTRMVFDQNVTYREEPGGGRPAREVRASLLNAGLNDAGTIDEAHFSGGFSLKDGPLSATSSEAIYKITDATLALRSPAGAAVPHLKNERLDLRAATVDVTLTPFKLTAAGKVNAQLAAGRQGDERRGVLDDNEPILALCETLVFDQGAGTSTYSGGARLVQPKLGNEIKGEVISVNDQTGLLTATGNVVTSLPLAARSDEGPQGNSIGRAQQFEFDDAKRTATFVKSAQLDGAQGTLHANRIELLLAADSNALQQMNADGTVRVNVESREATGQRLVYHPDRERYVLNGTPVRLVQGCQESTGRTLTFHRGTESVVVDGNEQIRVQTKGGKCAATP